MANTIPTTNLLLPPPFDLVAPDLFKLQEALDAHAEANGYKIVTRSSDLKKNKIRYVCHRSGVKPSESSISQKTDCPFAITASQVKSPNVPDHLQKIALGPNTTSSLPPVGSWTIYVKHPGHNHDPINSRVCTILCYLCDFQM